jgi:PHS family inorganic phosphate transporter-like MFS transporter
MTEEDGISEAERSVQREMDDDDIGIDDSSTVVVKSWWQNPAQVTAMVSNFSTSYNVVNISLVLPILEYLYEGSSEGAAACASSLLAGMMVGQVVGGALGDSFLGRLGALRLVMAVQIVASIGSAVSLWGDSGTIYIGLAIWRFVLGIGAGAVYPLAATLSAEQTETASSREELSPEDKAMQLKSVVLTFSMQGFGFLTVPLVAVPLLHLIPESSLDLVWRLLLGFGCLPGLLLIFLQCRLYRSSRPSGVEAIPQSEPDHDDGIGEATLEQRLEPLIPHDESEDEEEEFIDETDSDSPLEPAPGLWASIRKEPNLIGKLLGTAGTWFLFDVLFYGNTLFQPIVMEAAFGGKDTNEDDVIKKAAMDSLFLGLIALPGYAVSAVVIGKRFFYILQMPRYVQLQGFVAMAMLYATIGVCWSSLKQIPALLVVIYGMTFFFANYGPNTTTFVFPSLVFSRECRSTLNGISAAAGKAGALVGATSFAPAAAALGDDKVMLICAGVSVVAFALTYCFTRVPIRAAHHDHRS